MKLLLALLALLTGCASTTKVFKDPRTGVTWKYDAPPWEVDAACNGATLDDGTVPAPKTRYAGCYERSTDTVWISITARPCVAVHEVCHAAKLPPQVCLEVCK